MSYVCVFCKDVREFNPILKDNLILVITTFATYAHSVASLQRMWLEIIQVLVLCTTFR